MGRQEDSAGSRATSARMPGIDVARAVAVLGMVLVNYRAIMGAHVSDVPGLAWGMRQVEGKAAALFLLLAGVGISLRSRRARAQGGAALSRERLALAERAGVLLVVGLVHVHIWRWDILHFYGIYLALAAAIMVLRDRALLLVALGFAVGGVLLQTTFDWWQPTELWSWRGSISKLLFNGNYPVFPWMAFLAVGIWLGRRDLQDPAVRRPLLGAVLAVGTIAALLDVAARGESSIVLDEPWADWVLTWPRPARPGFVVLGSAVAIAVVCACVEFTQSRPSSRWVVALAMTGQMAFTLYLAHTVAVLIPMQHGLFGAARIEHAVIYALVFFAVAVVVSVWWRRRWPHGPLEGLIRQFTGRREADGPWSGPRLAD